MKKIILFTILSILFLAFFALIFNTYQLQKSYFDNKNKSSEINNSNEQDETAVTPSFYRDYSKEDYDLALNEERVLVLFFTANWCTDCILQEEINSEVFSNLAEGVVGLEIHILDSETTTETDALAKKFDVTKESSFVILDRNGAVSTKYVGSLSSDLLKTKIMDVLNK